jgi:hypothetical protein
VPVDRHWPVGAGAVFGHAGKDLWGAGLETLETLETFAIRRMRAEGPTCFTPRTAPLMRANSAGATLPDLSATSSLAREAAFWAARL